MSRTKKRKSSRSTRGALRLPGRPPVGRREDRCAFWAAIARGLYPGAAVAAARVSWVVGRAGFGKVVVCRPHTSLRLHPRSQVAICPSQNVNSSGCFMRASRGCARLHASWNGRPRPSRGSCAAMRQRAVVPSITWRRRRSGTRIARPCARSLRSWRLTRGFGKMYRIG